MAQLLPYIQNLSFRWLGQQVANIIEFKRINKEVGWGLFAKKKTSSLLIRRIYRMLYLKIDDYW